jgi:hypothetical protein
VLDDLINKSLKRVNFPIELTGRFCKVKLLAVILAEEEEISGLIIHAVDHQLTINEPFLVIQHIIARLAVDQL